MKKLIFWNYQRGTWQYDLFCLLIIAFIFLTPKDWFRGKKDATLKRPLAVQTQDFSSNENNLKNQFITPGDAQNTVRFETAK